MKYKFKLIFDLEIGYYSNVKVMQENSDYKLNHIGDVSVNYRNMDAKIVNNDLIEHDFKAGEQNDIIIKCISQRILDMVNSLHSMLDPDFNRLVTIDTFEYTREE